MLRNKLFSLLIVGCLLPTICFAAITFTDGKWETTFDCDAHEANVNTLDCDGLSSGLTDGEQYDPTCTTGNEEIASRANYSGGGGGLGQVHKTCGTTNAASSSSGGLCAILPSTETELWIRWYMKFPSGFSWFNDYASNKIIFCNGDPTDAVFKFQYTDGFGVFTQGGNSGAWYDVDGGWATTMDGTTGDGEWHYYEVHVKIGSAHDNGIFEFWIDDRTMYTDTDVDFDMGSFSDVRIGSNFHYVDGVYEVFYDDIVIYNTTPPNTDADGNSYIGPIDSTTTATNQGCYSSGGQF